MVFTPPQTYTAYAFTKKGGNLEKITVEWKDPQPGEIVVKVLACGVCHSDQAVQWDLLGIKYPRVPGHEIVGSIVALPPTEETWKLEQIVGSGWHGGHDGTCLSCRKGDYLTCQNEGINGINRDGGYAEYVTLRTEAVAPVPDGFDPTEAAPFFCAGVTVFNSIRNAGAQPGDVVAVQGIGGLGHLALQFCRAMGYKTIALSSGDSKRALATELGAHVYIDGSKEDQAAALQALGGATVIAATAPNAKAIGPLVHGLAVNGKLLLLALSEDVTVPVGPMVVKRLSVIGWPGGTHQDSAETLQFARQAGIRCMVTTFPLEKAQEAYDHVAQARFRAVITP